MTYCNDDNSPATNIDRYRTAKPPPSDSFCHLYTCFWTLCLFLGQARRYIYCSPFLLVRETIIQPRVFLTRVTGPPVAILLQMHMEYSPFVTGLNTHVSLSVTVSSQ